MNEEFVNGNINWDDYKELSYINEEGTYTLTIKSCEVGTSANGKPYHKFTCESTDGEQITMSLYLVANAMWKYKIFAQACGLAVKGADNMDSVKDRLIGKQFVGEVCRQADKLNVETGMYEPSKYFEITKFHKLEA